MTQLLEIEGLHCRYADQDVVADLSLNISPGMLSCLLGPSGCGKTTVLRAIAGFESIKQGEIRLNGQIVSSPGYTLPPERRGLGMVFQDYALFPHSAWPTISTSACSASAALSAGARWSRCWSWWG
ncbi:ferric iron ABC transporter, ATP-binding protein [endosymbiont of Riftia pachyptila (vent Ph05)]|uniref:Ferric iron ABC transporter, ATP-binding protein n=1 Tax=endosymbiont of Riftia pachyptila (vent Ph05) TaxID=1048808 RepID=G2DEV3_9GAMM|nr:ferric iron ABC transporter, ATP-binding protein [endosymbiont of Riftia pachyptila (vent Ph05)]